MKEIVALNQRILAEAPGVAPKETGFFLVTSEEGEQPELAALPAGIRSEVEELRRQLRSALPDDFEYQMILAHEDPCLMIVYFDGVQTVGACPVEWDDERSVIQQLKEINCDQHRAAVLSQGQTFDEMAAQAEAIPSRLPSTREIQMKFRDEMSEFVKDQRKDASKVHVMLWRDGEGMRNETYEDMKAFRWDLPNIMTVQYLVVTVVADGKPLTVEKLERLKSQALKELEGMPISHARALGKL